MYTEKLTKLYDELKDTCRTCHRDPRSVSVVFATKYIDGPELAQFLHEALKFHSHINVGENRVQDAEVKLRYLSNHHPELLQKITPILIGSLQKNKINKAIELFEEIQSIDSLELAQAMNERLERVGKRMKVWLQVNVSKELTKHGMRLEDVDRSLKSLKELRSLEVIGLMTMAPHEVDIEKTRGVFRTLRDIADRHDLKTSMGMSNDWHVAVEEGSDVVRVGSKIFSI